jgi:hypothetical protein
MRHVLVWHQRSPSQAQIKDYRSFRSDVPLEILIDSRYKSNMVSDLDFSRQVHTGPHLQCDVNKFPHGILPVVMPVACRRGCGRGFPCAVNFPLSILWTLERREHDACIWRLEARKLPRLDHTGTRLRKLVLMLALARNRPQNS